MAGFGTGKQRSFAGEEHRAGLAMLSLGAPNAKLDRVGHRPSETVAERIRLREKRRAAGTLVKVTTPSQTAT
jgi:hypothetical protein